MVLDFDDLALEEIRQVIEEQADAVDTFTDRRSQSRNSFYNAVANEIDDTVHNPILARARQLAEPHVGSDRTQTIRPVEGEWAGTSYVAGLRSDNEVVLSHEFGSGIHHDGNKYRITPGDADKLAFRGERGLVVIDYVMHPGVRGKRFMEAAIREHGDHAAGEAIDSAEQSLRELLSNS